MAEERISVHRCSNKCRCLREVSCDILKEEGIPNGTYCSAYIHGTWQRIDPEKDCKDCQMAEYNGLSRTEAIERMAVAMCLKCNNTDKCENCLSASNGDCDLKSYYPLAESALDALVGKNLSALDKLNKVN